MVDTYIGLLQFDNSTAKLSATMAMVLPPDGVARERKEESGRALGECGVSWRP